MLVASLQPSVVSFGDGFPYELGIIPSGASALGRGELCGVNLCFCSKSLTVTVNRSSLPESLCSPAASAERRAFARRFVHGFTSARGATHTEGATLGKVPLVREARASAQEEGSSQYQEGAATSWDGRSKRSLRESVVTAR